MFKDTNGVIRSRKFKMDREYNHRLHQWLFFVWILRSPVIVLSKPFDIFSVKGSEYQSAINWSFESILSLSQKQ